jgi:hypothetical protein
MDFWADSLTDPTRLSTPHPARHDFDFGSIISVISVSLPPTFQSLDEEHGYEAHTFAGKRHILVNSFPSTHHTSIAGRFYKALPLAAYSYCGTSEIFCPGDQTP